MNRKVRMITGIILAGMLIVGGVMMSNRSENVDIMAGRGGGSEMPW